MNITYDNSMYCTNPPSIPTPTPSPEEELEEQINKFLEEEKNYFSYHDDGADVVRELNKNESERRI